MEFASYRLIWILASSFTNMVILQFWTRNQQMSSYFEDICWLNYVRLGMDLFTDFFARQKIDRQQYIG